MFDIDRVNALLKAQRLTTCEVLHGLERRHGKPCSALCRGVALLEQRLDLPGLDSDTRNRYRTNTTYRDLREVRMTMGERIRDLEARLAVHLDCGPSVLTEPLCGIPDVLINRIDCDINEVTCTRCLELHGE